MYTVQVSTTLEVTEHKSLAKAFDKMQQACKRLELPHFTKKDCQIRLKVNTRIKFRKGKDWVLIRRIK